MTIKYYPELEQGSDEWFQARCGILTASEMKNVINKSLEQVKPTAKEAARGKDVAHLYTLLSQRIWGHVPPHFLGYDMIRGHEDEIYAKIEYEKKYAPIEKMGFITNDKWGFTIGFSPDGLVGLDGLIESKSRNHKFQMETILDGEMPDEFGVQVQTGMMVSERIWCDFISYPEMGGADMLTIRIEACKKTQEKIADAATDFEKRLQEKMRLYRDIVKSGNYRLTPTERRQPTEDIRV